ncbi:MAG: cysteine--tRNA ligase [Candidatus Micrarchaeota archaeon]|nr:cysteine--tRNA ligase [Candidatus Micrarchaeota archaeon]
MLKVYNTLTRSYEEFVPMNDGRVKMFVCGQTVYDDAHIGHAKTYIDFDIVARWLRHKGYDLTYLQNITDVDDKIIARAKERGMDPVELARMYEKRFLEDMDSLGVRNSVSDYPRSHDYIEPVRDQIQLLLNNGYAYIRDNDVFYDVSKFADYTKLSGMKLEDLERHRIEPDERKKNPYDFSLWKGAKEGEPSWEISLRSGWKTVKLKGRPGWHIEDTAITATIFGPQYDLHGGAHELIFPHQTNEIAQAEAAFGKKPFVKYWLHSGVLNIKGQKMSKSLKNFITIRSVLERNTREAIRLMVAKTHYRKELNFTDDTIKEAQRHMDYLYSALTVFNNMPEGSNEGVDSEVAKLTREFEDDFTAAMDDDFNTSLALSKLTITINRLKAIAESGSSISRPQKDRAISTIVKMANTLGLLEEETYRQKLPDEVRKLISRREALRSQKNFAESDTIRDRLKSEFGIEVEDTEFGTVWYRR